MLYFKVQPTLSTQTGALTLLVRCICCIQRLNHPTTAAGCSSKPNFLKLHQTVAHAHHHAKHVGLTSSTPAPCLWICSIAPSTSNCCSIPAGGQSAVLVQHCAPIPCSSKESSGELTTCPRWLQGVDFIVIAVCRMRGSILRRIARAACRLRVNTQDTHVIPVGCRYRRLHQFMGQHTRRVAATGMQDRQALAGPSAAASSASNRTSAVCTSCLLCI